MNRIKKDPDQDKKDLLFVLIESTDKNREKSKSRNVELRRIKNRAKQMLSELDKKYVMMNGEKQIKNLLSRLKKDKRSVLYVNETTANI